jgi:hypothetical protein
MYTVLLCAAVISEATWRTFQESELMLQQEMEEVTIKHTYNMIKCLKH